MTNKTIPTVKHPFRTERGDTFIVVLFLLLIAGTVIGVVCTQTASMARNANRSYQFEMAQVAANGAMEYAYAVWLKRTANKHNLLSSTSDLALNYTPQFSTVNSVTGGTTVLSCSVGICALDKYGRQLGSGNSPDPVIGPVWGFPGWWGRAYTYAATATVLTSDSTVSATVRQFFTYTEVPLFQCMYFFQHDLEIYNPAQMSLYGLVHTNGNLYLSAQQSSMLNIGGNVTYSGTYFSVAAYGTGSIPPGSINTDSNIGKLQDPNWLNSATATKVSAISAMGENFEAVFSDTNNIGNPNVSGSYHELIEPAQSGTDPLGEKRLCNIAANSDNQTGQVGGLLIYITGSTISANSIEITSLDPITKLPTVSDSNAYTVHIGVGTGASISNTAAFISALVSTSASSTAISKKLANSGSSIISGTSRLFDAREGTYMNVVDINMAALQTALQNVNNFSNIIYINDSSSDTKYYTVTSTTNSYTHAVTTSTTTYTTENTIRLLNGSTITGSDGLTIASYNPVYLQGDFNTGGTGNSVPSNVAGSSGTAYTTSTYANKPTALIADAISLLSNNWSDVTSTNSLSSRNPSNTTYNVALLGGYITSGTKGDYSGGAINYPRFLEDWNDGSSPSKYYCTYYGSMVELFPSLTSTDHWVYPGSSSAYYTAPQRRFNFDTLFSYKSPPGSVNAVFLSRGIWSPASK